MDDRQRAPPGADASPGAATSVSPTAWSIASSSRRRPPPSVDDREADRAHVDARHQAGALGAAAAATGARGEVAVRGLEQVGRAAERRDHAREALRGGAAGAGARRRAVGVAVEAAEREQLARRARA